jgi:dTDP-4-dehydrorhamnose 3,5-epimerase
MPWKWSVEANLGGIAGLTLFTPQSDPFEDERGTLDVPWDEAAMGPFVEKVVPGFRFVQENVVSFRERGVLRGLHGKLGGRQAKMVRCLSGVVWDVAVDFRKGSPTFGKWHGVFLSDKGRMQLLVPPGCLHGVVCSSKGGGVASYRMTELFDAETERGARHDDASLNIEWAVEPTVVSEKDLSHKPFSELQTEVERQE